MIVTPLKSLSNKGEYVSFVLANSLFTLIFTLPMSILNMGTALVSNENATIGLREEISASRQRGFYALLWFMGIFGAGIYCTDVILVSL